MGPRRTVRPGAPFVAGLLAAVLTAACGAPGDEPAASDPAADGTAAAEPAPSPSRQDEAIRQAREQALQRKRLEQPPQPPAATTDRGTGEVPAQVLADVRGHLAHRIGVDPGAIEMVQARPHTWPDGAMGCPQPGLVYTHQPVEGYWMILHSRGRDYDYRVSKSGTLVLCEGRLLEDPPTA